jgi:hypothetical protein
MESIDDDDDDNDDYFMILLMMMMCGVKPSLTITVVWEKR